MRLRLPAGVYFWTSRLPTRLPCGTHAATGTLGWRSLHALAPPMRSMRPAPTLPLQCGASLQLYDATASRNQPPRQLLWSRTMVSLTQPSSLRSSRLSTRRNPDAYRQVGVSSPKVSTRNPTGHTSPSYVLMKFGNDHWRPEDVVESNANVTNRAAFLEAGTLHSPADYCTTADGAKNAVSISP